MSRILVDLKSILLVEYSKNNFSYELMERSIHDDQYMLVDDIIYYKEWIYLIPKSTLKDNILREVHDVPMAGY
jgi:hypothetical protein